MTEMLLPIMLLLLHIRWLLRLLLLPVLLLLPIVLTVMLLVNRQRVHNVRRRRPMTVVFHVLRRVLHLLLLHLLLPPVLTLLPLLHLWVLLKGLWHMVVTVLVMHIVLILRTVQ